MLPNELLLEVINYLDVDDITNLFLVNKTTYNLSSIKQSLVIKRLYIPWKLKRARGIIVYKRLSYIQKTYSELIINQISFNFTNEWLSDIFEKSIINDDVDICKFVIRILNTHKLILIRRSSDIEFELYERYIIKAIECKSNSCMSYFYSLRSCMYHMTEDIHSILHLSLYNPQLFYLAINHNNIHALKIIIKIRNRNINRYDNRQLLNALVNCILNNYIEMFEFLYKHVKKNLTVEDMDYLKSACSHNVIFIKLL